MNVPGIATSEPGWLVSEGRRVVLKFALVSRRMEAPAGAGRRPEFPVERSYIVPNSMAEMLFATVCRKHGVDPYRQGKRVRGEMRICASKSELDRVAADYRTLKRAWDDFNVSVLIHLVGEVIYPFGTVAGRPSRHLIH